MAESFVERRKRERGLATASDNSTVSFVERRKMERGLLPPDKQKEVGDTLYSDGMKATRLMEVEGIKQRQEESKVKQAKFNDTVYGGTDKLKQPTKKYEFGTTNRSPQLKTPVSAITKVKDQKNQIGKMGVNSTISSNKVLTERAAKETAAKYGMTVKELADVRAANEAKHKPQFEKIARMDAQAEKARNIPVIGEGLHRLDNMAANTKGFSDIAQSLYTPSAGLSMINMATKGVGAAISRVAPKIGNGSGLLPRMTTRAIEEAATGVPLSVGNTLARNPESSNRELGISALAGGVGGAVLGGAGPVVGDAIGMAANRLRNRGTSLPEAQPNQPIGQTQRVVPEATPIRTPADLSERPTNLSGSRGNPLDSTDDVEEILQSVQQPRVRDRVVSFLDEQEKAALDRIAKRKGNLNSLPVDEWADHAIVMAAQLGKGTIKSVDFTEELVKRFGEAARPHAQAIYTKSKEVLRQQERRASKEGQEAISFNESGLGDASSFEKKITRSTGIVGTLKRRVKDFSFDEKWERFKTQFTEDIAPANKLERKITGGIASAEDSFYKSARLFKGVPEKVNQFIEQQLKPIVRQIEKSGHHSDDLGSYALAVHARDVNASGIKSGYTNAEIDAVIRKFGTPEMEAARKQLVNLNKGLLDDLVDSGVVPKEMRDALNERWKNYVPLFRDVDDVVGNRTGLSEALANVANPIKRLKGSEKNVIDPIENMVENIIKNINAAERNKVASHISKLSKLDPDEKFIRRLKDGEGIEGKSVVSVKENGNNVYYEVEKDVRDAILTLDKESSTWLMRFLSTPASWLRAGATLTPEFIIRNPLRDYRNARIVSESGFRLDDYAVGLASSIMGKFGKGKLYQDWVKNLGAYGNIVSEDRKVFMAAQKKVLTQSNSQKFVNIVNPGNLIKILRGISDISESSTKVGEYRAALRKGATKQEAAYRARDIMDFARAGSSIRQTNKIVAFLNANIQGKSKMVRAFKNHPVKTSINVFRTMAVPTAGIYFYNKQFANEKQKETIKNAPDWQRNTFWLIAIPGTDMVGRFPKPFDFAVVANVVDRSLDFFEANNKEAFEGFAQGVVADNALPMMITGLQPLLEGVSNYSAFRQGPIIPQRDSGLKPEDQYDPVKTSGTARAIAGGIDKTFGKLGGNFRSPYIIDNTIQGLFAGGGKYATDAIDAILGKTGATDKPKAPEKSIEQKPVLRSFMVDPNQGGKVMDKFYDAMDELDKERNSNKRNDVTFGKQKKSSIYLPADKEKLRKSFNAASDDVSAINTEIRAIEKEKTFTPKQKREQIDKLIADRKKIIEGAVKQ